MHRRARRREGAQAQFAQPRGAGSDGRGLAEKPPARHTRRPEACTGGRGAEKAHKRSSRSLEAQAATAEGSPRTRRLVHALARGALGTQALGTQALGMQAPGGQVLGAQALGMQAPGGQVLGAQALGAQALGARVLGARALGARALGAQAQGTQALGTQALGGQVQGA
jgi:hypothetical protein